MQTKPNQIGLAPSTAKVGEYVAKWVERSKASKHQKVFDSISTGDHI